jgi:hypothetical protein
MKKLLLITGIFLCTITVKAQSQGDAGLNLYGGYTFQDQIQSNGSSIKIKDAFQYGAGLEFYLRPTKSIELKYLRMDTKTPIYNALGVQQNANNDSSAINYVLLAGNNYFPTSNPSIKPFAGLGLGLGWASGDNSTSARFAWDIKAGVKIKASDAVSVKLQAYFQTIWATGSTYYRGYYSPIDASLYQFGLGAALAFDFKH